MYDSGTVIPTALEDAGLVDGDIRVAEGFTDPADGLGAGRMPTTGAGAEGEPSAAGDGRADAGCVTPAENVAVADAGLVDAGLVDAGLVDAGLVDGGLVDGGLVDGGTVTVKPVPSTCTVAPIPAAEGFRLMTAPCVKTVPRRLLTGGGVDGGGVVAVSSVNAASAQISGAMLVQAWTVHSRSPSYGTHGPRNGT